MEIVRTKKQGVYQKVTNRAWGTYYLQIEDPQADVEQVDKFVISKDFPKIPADLWAAIANLYIDYAHYKDTEVQVLLLRDENTLRQWKCVVPRQKVTFGSVDASNFNDCIDILSGEAYNIFPVPGWVYAGSSHSHGTMKLATFSGVDDLYELTAPGTHILVSCIDTKTRKYKTTGSIVLRKTRFYVDADNLIDDSRSNTTYHPAVKEYIAEAYPTTRLANYGTTYRSVKTTKYATASYQQNIYDYPESDYLKEDFQQIAAQLLFEGISKKELIRLIEEVDCVY